MPKGTKICKVCGVEYPYCKTENRGNRFRYQDVACCPEHGSIYFAKILESRKETPKENVSSIADKNDVITNFSDLIDDEEDELFEEYFEDDDDEDDDDEFE